jgi:hypothetical protein
MNDGIEISKKRGRPATGERKTIGVRCDDEMLKRVDDFRREEPDIPARPEAMRRLIEAGLRATKTKKGR